MGFVAGVECHKLCFALFICSARGLFACELYSFTKISVLIFDTYLEYVYVTQAGICTM